MSDYGQAPPPPPPPAGAPYGGFPAGGPTRPKKSRKPLLFILIGVALLVIAAIVVTLLLVLGGDDNKDDDRDRKDERTSASDDESESDDPSTDPEQSDGSDDAAGGAGGIGTDQGDDDVTPLVGTWQGAYVCNQGETGLTLTISEGPDGKPEAVFAFGPTPTNPDVPRGSYKMAGTFIGDVLTLEGGDWIERPDGFLTVDLEARISDPAGDTISGSVVGAPGCTAFTVKRQ